MLNSVVKMVSLDYIKELDNSFNDTLEDNLVEGIILGVSSLAANFLGRNIVNEEVTELFDYRGELDTNFRLRSFPVSVITEVKNKAGDILVIDDVIEVKKSNGVGILKDITNVPIGFEVFSVKYTGGMATDTADFMANYPDITYQAAMQVIFEYKRKKTIALVSGDIGRNGQDTYEKWGLRVDFIRALKPYKVSGCFG